MVSITDLMGVYRFAESQTDPIKLATDTMLGINTDPFCWKLTLNVGVKTVKKQPHISSFIKTTTVLSSRLFGDSSSSLVW